MGEINFQPFEEEDAYTATALQDRFTALAQQGIDDLTNVAFQDGCLNENHLPSFVSFADTVEFYEDAVLNVNYESGYDSVTPAQTGLSYWNGTPAASPVVQNYPPDDGVWGVIQDGAGNELKVTLPAPVNLSDPDFDTRFGLDSFLVMMNAQVERFETYEEDGQTAISPGALINAPAIAFAIQVSLDGANWYHLYLGDSQFTSASATGTPPYRYRITERRIRAFEAESDYTSRIGTDSYFPTRRDAMIRTIINKNSIANTVNAQNSKGAITSFQYIRAVVSVIKRESLYNKVVRVKLRKANLTVLGLRAAEVEPNA
jgi:hypothetical protein